MWADALVVFGYVVAMTGFCLLVAWADLRFRRAAETAREDKPC
jgi:hypothetical protein